MLKNRKYVFLFFIFNLFSCAFFQTYTEDTGDLFPQEIDLPGWKASSGPRVFNGVSLQEYIKKSDDLHLLNLYGFRELSTVEYRSLSKPDNSIKIEIFEMNTPLNAFGILSREKNDEFREDNLCEESYTNGQNHVSRKNNYYIKIIPRRKYTGLTNDSKLFLKAVCDKIGSQSELPDYLSLFSDKANNVSLKYWVEGYPKLPEIKHVFSKKIEFAGKKETIFFAKRNSGYISLGELSNLLRNRGDRFILSHAGELQIAFLKKEEDDYIFISSYKEWIFGVFDAQGILEGESTVNYLYQKINEFLMQSR